MSEKERLDIAMVAREMSPSRQRAQAMIMAGVVYVGGVRASKPSHVVLETDEIVVRTAPHPYVSRGGLKLEKALSVFGGDMQGVVAMDVGASTGGFTDVLLRAGAAHVYAIDVGYGQLDWKLRNDPRVTVMERTNARFLTREQLEDIPTLCVMDVAFISIKLLLPAISTILGAGGRVISLIKPQFEAGRENVGKKGVVRDPAVHAMVLRDIRDFVHAAGHSVCGLTFSPITGPEGNIEFLFDIHLFSDTLSAATDENIQQIIEESHKAR